MLGFGFTGIEACQISGHVGFAFGFVIEGEYSSLWWFDELFAGGEIHGCHG